MALTGFLVNMGAGNTTVCADGAANAILALGARFPYVAGSQPLMCNLEASVFVPPASFNNTITCHDLTGNAFFTKTHLLSLMQCDPMTWGVNLTQIFSMPASPDVATAWMLGFSLPMICYLAAWGFGVVINMFKDH